jgi:hypothetical protein
MVKGVTMVIETDNYEEMEVIRKHPTVRFPKFKEALFQEALEWLREVGIIRDEDEADTILKTMEIEDPGDEPNVFCVLYDRASDG